MKAALAAVPAPSVRGIAFNDEMVRAILGGRKTQTRRVVKWPIWVKEDERLRLQLSPTGIAYYVDGRPVHRLTCPFGAPSDVLFVKEAFAGVYDCPELPCCEDGERRHRRLVYRATEPKAIGDYACSFDCNHDEPGCARWSPSSHMTQAEARLWLRITDVRVQRLQEISEEDARAEGCDGDCPIGYLPAYFQGPLVYHFAQVWDSIYGEEGEKSWTANPWVWALTFERTERPA